MSSTAQFRIGAFAIIRRGEEVLLSLRRDIGWWNLPGGGMEKGETVEETVIREVREETGLDIAVERLVGVYSKPQKDEVVLTFLCQQIGGQLITTEEALESRFFVPDHLPEKILPKHRQRLSDALLNQPQAVLRAQRTTTAQDQNLLPANDPLPEKAEKLL